MSLAEAPFNRPTPRKERRWTGRESIAKFYEIQGLRVNLLSAPGTYEANHAHSGQTLLSVRRYSSYLKENGLIIATGWAPFSDNDALGFTVYLYEHIGWPPAIAARFFPMIDFMVSLEVVKPQRRHDPILIPVNTTQVESTIYEVDIPIGERVPRNPDTLLKYVESRIEREYSKPDFNGCNIDAFQITEKGQRLISDLLNARA